MQPILGGLSTGEAEGEGAGPYGAKEEKRGSGGKGWGQVQELPKVRTASYCCNNATPFSKLALSEGATQQSTTDEKNSLCSPQHSGFQDDGL